MCTYSRGKRKIDRFTAGRVNPLSQKGHEEEIEPEGNISSIPREIRERYREGNEKSGALAQANCVRQFRVRPARSKSENTHVYVSLASGVRN
jgi:hypothetical protein